MISIPYIPKIICSACIIDVRNGDAEDAHMLRIARLEYARVCNPTGGECEDSPCCDGIECVDFGGNAGKFCGGDMTVSHSEKTSTAFD